MADHITSDRLILSGPIQEDFNRYYEIHSDPGTNLFNPYGPMNLASAEKSFLSIKSHWEKHGFGPWSIRKKDQEDLVIGFGGLDYRLYGDDMRLNLGYRFDKYFWGKGYATELALATIEFGFKQLNKKEIFAIVRPAHKASINVLEKCKMALIYELNDVPGERNSLVYRIDKAQ